MSTIWMDVDAALAEVPVNVMPLIDDTDFKSIESALAYNASGMALRWHFMTCAGAYTITDITPTTGGDYDWSAQGADGIYTIEIPASGGASVNNNAEGFGWFTGFITGVLPWRGPTIGFRAAGLNDALIESSWSTTRGLSGAALPDANFDAAGGLPISDAGGLDLDAILIDTASLNDTKIPDTLSLANINTEVDNSHETYHLDKFFLNNYDPDSKPGSTTALMNELMESDGGVARYSANALENAPDSAGTNSMLIRSTLITAYVDTLNMSVSATDADADAYNDLVAVITDQTDGTQKSWVGISDYTAAGALVLYEAAKFTVAVGDTIDILAIPYATLAQINAQVDTALTDYDGPTDAEMDTGFSNLQDVSAADVLTQATTALTNYDPPTKTELDNGFAALNDISTAEVNTQADLALTDYDAPTNTEMLAAHTTTDALISGLNDLSAAQVNTEVDTALSDYDGPTNTEMLASFTALNDPTAATIASAILDKALSAHVTIGTVGKALGDIESDVTLVLADTAELQGDWVNGGRLDLILDARSSQSSVDTIDGIVDDILLDTGTTLVSQISGLNNLSAAQVNAECDTALTDYDAPTNAEMLASFTALNDLSAATVNAQVDVALTDYDAPTNAEMLASFVTTDALVSGLNALSAATVLTQVSTGLATYDGPTNTEMLAAFSTTDAGVTALNNLSAADVNAEVDNALAGYDGPTKTEMDAGFAAIAGSDVSAITSGILDALLASYTVTGSVGEALGIIGTGDGDATVANQSTIIAAITALNDIDAATVNTQVDTALTDYDGPTQTEILAAHSTTDALISGLTDISAAAVNAEVANALTTYDPPTRTEATADKAEIVVDIAALSIPSAATISSTVWGAATRALTDKDGFTLTSGERDAISTLLRTDLQDISAADVLAQASAALATYDPPTRTEASSDASGITSAISALNDLTAAQVNAQVDIALSDYDSATNTEMLASFTTTDALITGLNDPSVAEIRTELATELGRIDVALSTRLSTAGYSDVSSDVTTILADTAELQVLIDELTEGTTPNRAYSTAALANAALAGGDATLANQTTIIGALNSGAATVISIVDGGSITTKVGDSHTGASVINLTVADTGATLHAKMTAAGVTEVKMGVSDGSSELFTGTITKGNITESSDVTTIPIAITSTATIAVATSNDYSYDIQYTDADGDHTPIEGNYCLRPNFAA